MQKINDLKDKLIIEVTTKNLSEVLPNLIEFASKTKHTTLRKLCIDELYGYEDEDEIPKYRNLPVDFFDKVGKKIVGYEKGSVLTLDEVMQQEVLYYRGTMEGFEDLAIERGIKSINVLQHPIRLTIKNTSYEAYSYECIPRHIQTKILELKKVIISLLNDFKYEEESLEDDFRFTSLHDVVISTSADLYFNGHYRQAVLDATIALVNRVKEKSQLKNFDNTPLMQKAFSPNNPILKVSDDKDLQTGFMWLFSGSVMTFRNVNAHHLNPKLTKSECLEQLSFLSMLHKVLDDKHL